MKSRINWLNEGDANTKFFHQSTLNRRRCNHITAIQDPAGNWCYDIPTIKSTFINFFCTLFTTEFTLSYKSLPFYQYNVIPPMQHPNWIDHSKTLKSFRQYTPLNYQNLMSQTVYTHTSIRNTGLRFHTQS